MKATKSFICISAFVVSSNVFSVGNKDVSSKIDTFSDALSRKIVDTALFAVEALNYKKNDYIDIGFSSDDAEFLKENGCTVPSLKKRQEEGFKNSEIIAALKVKILHDKTELAAYDALGKYLIENGISDISSEISNDQSKHILHKVIKPAAHKEMRSSTGYMSQRMNHLNEKQMQGVIENVNFIISDRDSKLTKAEYTNIKTLLEALDAHNGSVNKILFNSWGVPESDRNHINRIKFLSRIDI